MAEDTTAVKKIKPVTLVSEYDIYDSTEGVAKWYRSGDVFDVIPAFLQLQVEMDAVKLV